ncbi:MAG: TetR/AcrR family transcriptional regulator [Treponema sp.]|nr:TetR/AcrR family transcriptional regulator [Treponema sp.]
MIKKQTAKDLLVASILELSDSKNLDKITVKDICDNCSLSTQTFYNNFSDKYELILYVYKSVYENLFAKLDVDGYAWKDLLLEILRFYAKHAHFMVNAHQNTHGYDSFSKICAREGVYQMKNYICKKRKISSLPDDITVYLKMYAFLIVETMADWISNHSQVPPENMMEYFFKGIPEPLEPYLLS